MPTPSVLTWYRGECYRSDATKHGPVRAGWTDGVTPALSITPTVDHLVNVTELVIVANSAFSLGGNTIDLSPWGHDGGLKESFADLNDFYSVFANVGGRVVVAGADPLHLVRVSFRPFIRIEFGTSFTVENSAGAAAALGDPGDFARITAFAFEVLAADE